MKVIRLFCCAFFAFLLVGVVSWPASAAAASVQDFSIRSFEADYYLTRDADKRSRLRVVEKIAAEFPAYDQNHGIERAITNEYDGHTVNFELQSVEDGSGKDLPYSTYESNKNTVIRIGDADKYVHGLQVYLIEYTLRDVTKGFSGHDEIYWDTNGTGWRQPFGSVRARLHLNAELAGMFNGQTRCFVGVAGSGQECRAATTKDNGGLTLTFDSGRSLKPGENVTFVAGFNKGTFAKYQPTAWEQAWPFIVAGWIAANVVLLIAIIIFAVRATRRHGRSPKGRATVVPEYLPPKDTSVLLSAAVLRRTAHAATAQIIDLAVRHFVKIYDVKAKSKWLGKKRAYELELVRPVAKLKPEERQLAEMIFGDPPQINALITLQSLSKKLYKQNRALLKDTQSKAEKQGYAADISAVRKRYYWKGALLLLLGLFLLPGVFIGGLVLLITAASWHPLTQKGVELRGYLEGLRKYMKLAEKDRLKMLQSPSGAARNINPDDKKQLIKLYEHLLPYAILFGMEKEWAKEFAQLYEEPPEWYGGDYRTFNAAVFAASLSGFNSATNTAFAPPASSSGSGFGGGSSGGGGGGGGGGW